MGTENREEANVVVVARDHFDPSGSVVHSGMMLAEAVLALIETGASVEVDLRDVRGVGSSYFNVFLRRVDEALGLAALHHYIRFRFASRIQEMVFERSLDAMKRGPRTPPG